MNFRALHQTGKGSILVNLDHVIQIEINSMTKKVNLFTTVGVIEVDDTFDEIKIHIANAIKLSGNIK